MEGEVARESQGKWPAINHARRPSSFLQRHMEEIRQGGLRVVVKKVFSVLGLAVWLWPVLAVRALRPIVTIRFEALSSSHIGHFAGNTQVYLCERDAGIHGKRAVDIWYHLYTHSGSPTMNKSACNMQLKKMWDRTLHVSPIAKYMNRYNNLIPGGEKHKVPWRRHNGGTDIHGLLPLTPPHLAFTSQEEQEGEAALREMGIPQGAHFICFHAHDSAYMESIFPKTDWSGQNYRDCDIRNYIPAAEELVRRGYHAIRMGAMVKEPLDTTNPMIVDYPIKYRSDFLDIYISSKCHFFLSSHGGIDELPHLFRRPVLYSNIVHITGYMILNLVPGSVITLKKLWLKNEDRFMSIRELVDSGFGSQDRHYPNHDEWGIDFIENSPEEITAVTIEMEQRLKGKWQTTEEDEILQRQFWSNFKTMEPDEVYPVRVGADFLRQNQYLLS